MAKYKRYQCDTCHKEIDVENNIRHVFLNQCTITNGCQGTLRFKQDRNTKQNFIQKIAPQQLHVGERVNKDEDEFVLLDTSADSSNNIILAIKNNNGNVNISDSSHCYLKFNQVKNRNTEFKEFHFNLLVPITALSGKDNSLEQKVLTVNNTNDVTIFINGEIIPSSAYNVANNLITFNEVITYSNYKSSSLSIKVLVQQQAEQEEKSLLFRKNVPYLASSAWSNVDTIWVSGELYSIFVCQELSNLALNSKLVITSASIDGVEINTSDCNFLLACSPFRVMDRVLNKVVNLTAFNTPETSLRFSVLSKKNLLITSSSNIKSIFPSIKTQNVFDPKKENEVEFSSASNDAALNNNILISNQYVIGPV